ncbi:hypothetical protein [Mucilaginibacter sp.]
MRKKELWMKIGNAVMAYGKPGIITALQENKLNDTMYVYYITVRLNGQKAGGQYHPNDVSELKEEVTNA